MSDEREFKMKPRCEERIDANGGSYLCELDAGHEGEHENAGMEWVTEEELRSGDATGATRTGQP